MNKTLKRILASALVLLTVTGCCASCADTPENSDVADTSATTSFSESEEGTVDRAHVPDNLPDSLDFGNTAVRIAHSDGGVNKQEVDPERDGDPVNEAVYERNVIVSERLHVTYEYYPLGDYTEMPSALSRSITSGSDDYDIVFCYQWLLLPQTLENMYLDLWDNEYIDTDQPWWWTDYINELKIGQTTFYTLNGDICLSSIKYIGAIFFNKNKMTDYNVDPESVYELVLDGNWTYEQLYTWMEMAYKDTNGNGKQDEDDQYGAFLRLGTEPDHFTYTAGNSMSTRDEDGYPTLTVETEYFANYMTYLVNMYYQNSGVWIDTDSTMDRDGLFADGKALFLPSQLTSADNLRDMADEYGIIPYPKWDTDQAEYGALVHDACTLVAIPTTTKKEDVASATIEALCAQSYRTVTPAYYDVALKCKYVSDATSGIIIDMIKNAARTDFVYAYNYSLNNVGLLCRTMVSEKNANLASAYKRVKRTAENSLTKMIRTYEKAQG